MKHLELVSLTKPIGDIEVRLDLTTSRKDALTFVQEERIKQLAQRAAINLANEVQKIRGEVA